MGTLHGQRAVTARGSSFLDRIVAPFRVWPSLIWSIRLTSNMLKKLFNGSHHSSSSNNSSSSLTRGSVLETNECDERTGYTASIAQLDEFEARLRDLLRTLTRHCQAITEMCSSARSFGDLLTEMRVDQSSVPANRQCDEALGLVNMFRVSAIAPLQSLLILVPQVRVRCEHRKSAMLLMLRYQRKVNDIERTNKSRTESTRLQRNRAKLRAATVRFRDLDNHVQQDIGIIVSNDIRAITGPPMRELLLRAQNLAGHFLVDNASRFDEHAKLRVETPEKLEESTSTEVEPEKGDLHQMSLPQRRLAMTVLPSTPEDNNVYVRQSVLAPLTSQTTIQALVATGSRQQQQTSRTATDDEHDSHCADDEGSGYDVTADLHEDYGIGKRKKHAHGTRRWDIHRHIKENMSTGLDLFECVRLPDGFARDEWVAVHVVDFFNEINLLYGTISEFCTAEACPKMSAGPCYAYTWADTLATMTEQHQSAAVHLPASQYVARLMDWIENQISDPAIFPPNGSTYRLDFEVSTARVILKRLFRVYAHMYHSHLEHFAELSADAHLGFCFKRFVVFVNEFDLIEEKELNALRRLVQTVLDNPIGELVPEQCSPELLA